MTTNSTNNYESYPILDSIAKGIIIDGLTTAVLLYAAPIIPALSTIIPLMPVKDSAINSAIYSAAASVSYLIRTDARENGHASVGGLEGGAFKYASRALVSDHFESRAVAQSTYLNKATTGAINNFLYEQCNNYKECGESPLISTVTATVIEGLESAITTPEDINIIDNSMVGALAGFIGASFANYIFVPNIQAMHDSYDYLENNAGNAYGYIENYATEYLNSLFVGMLANSEL